MENRISVNTDKLLWWKCEQTVVSCRWEETVEERQSAELSVTENECWKKKNCGCRKRTAAYRRRAKKKQQCVFSSRICYSAARTPTDANTTKSVICIGNGVGTASTAERMTSQPAYDNTIGRVKAWSERPTQRSSTASWAELSWALITA